MSWLQKIAKRIGKADVGQSEFPVRFELIAEKLSAQVYFHEVESRDGPVPCWTYVSEGLWGHQQKELILTLRRDPQVEVTAFPHDPLQFFVTVSQFAEQGKLVDVGDVSQFNPPGFLGRAAIVYVFPQPLLGVKTPSPSLTAVLLTEEELEAYTAFGLTRVQSRLGWVYRYYPCPAWSDLTRPSIPFKKTLQESILTRVNLIREHGMRVRLERNCITLRLFSRLSQPLDRVLAHFPSDTTNLAIALLTELDPGANGCLVWEPGQSGPTAIMPPGSDGSCPAGCFVAFLPSQAKDGGRILEDGFCVVLTNVSWAAIRKAIETQQDILVPATQEGDFSFSLKWLEEAYSNPIDNLTYHSVGGWESYKPETLQHGEGVKLVEVKEIVLLTGEPEMTTRVSVEALAAYTQSVETSVREHFTMCASATGQDLLAQFEILPNGIVDLQMASRPEILAEVLHDLHNRLLTLPPPKVNQGPIKFQMVFAIGGGSSISAMNSPHV